MRIPEYPAVTELKHLSPSLYEAVLACKARAAWIAFGEHEAVPAHPWALLGISVHAVIEKTNDGGLPDGDPESRRAMAREIFDRKTAEIFAQAHPLLREKFPAAERIPFYYLFRERAAFLAIETSASTGLPDSAAAASVQGRAAKLSTLVERRLRSRDGLLIGRPDYVDIAAGEVIDYKAGAGPEDDPEGLRESEARQLRLYVHLAHETGFEISRGAVLRADGRRAELSVSEAEADAEGHRAREALRAFNAQAAVGFEGLAEPSPESCRYCPCIPFCNEFWRKATAAWAEQCGTHVEGKVIGASRSSVYNVALATLELDVRHGTIGSGAVVLQQLPETWACADGAPPPEVGDVVRIVNCRPADGGQNALVLRRTADDGAVDSWPVDLDRCEEWCDRQRGKRQCLTTLRPSNGAI